MRAEAGESSGRHILGGRLKCPAKEPNVFPEPHSQAGEPQLCSCSASRVETPGLAVDALSRGTKPRARGCCAREIISFELSLVACL